MSYTSIQICNKALGLLSAEPITNEDFLTDQIENLTVTEKLCRGQYAILRDALLMEHGWTFANKTVLFTPEDGNGTCSDPQYADKPSCDTAGETWTPDNINHPFVIKLDQNILRVIGVELVAPFITPVSWLFSNRIIFLPSNEQVEVVYVSTEFLNGTCTDTQYADEPSCVAANETWTEPEGLSAQFADVLSLKIAAELCYTLTASSGLYEILSQKYYTELRNAKGVDSMQGVNQTIVYRGFRR